MSQPISQKSSIFKVQRTSKCRFYHERGLGNLDLSRFIITWSGKYFMDKMWRDKHNIPFNSEQHRSTLISDMLIELLQDKFIENLRAPEKEIKYNPGTGKYLKERVEKELSQDEISDAFDNIDLTDLQYDSDGKLLL